MGPTRRSKRKSRLSCVILRLPSSRWRYEREYLYFCSRLRCSVRLNGQAELALKTETRDKPGSRALLLQRHLRRGDIVKRRELGKLQFRALIRQDLPPVR